MLKLATLFFLAVAFIGTLLGCGSVHSSSPPPASAIQCGPANNYMCASGLLCYYGEAYGQIFGKCLTPPDHPMPVTEDGGMTQPDMWGIQGTTDGCRSGHGFVISATSVACPGIFASDPSMIVCGSGWSTCAQNPLPASVCKGHNPFGVQACFIGTVRAADRNLPTDITTMVGTWAGADASQYRYILGCGTCIGWSDAAIQLGGFTNTIGCDLAAYDFQCPKTVPGKDSDFLKVSNKAPDNGVFCCKD